MNTLKYLLMAVLTALIGFNGYAGNPTDEDVDNYKASIISFVKAEGYMPKLDSDGDIAFKHDGDSYWIQSSSYDDGYYVTVMTMTSVEGENINTIRKAMDDTARGLKFVRLYSSPDAKVVTISYSWYCISIVDFKRMFSNALSVVSTADFRFIKNYLAE